MLLDTDRYFVKRIVRMTTPDKDRGNPDDAGHDGSVTSTELSCSAFGAR